eukprot:TRINITY_DN19439_c0_g1_i1.p1 TRINITY_DN19439_c0_g1~~TRINITY_DN19439_c0_g1_i1.p1  ORF type:complete len:200 (-),score=26.38 TRINITY_DN19439_c0_g1_i1:154-753(-)
MSCYFCGYRFRWELEEGNNKCPKCKRLRKWEDKSEDSIDSGYKLRSYYYSQKIDDVHPERIHKVSTLTDSANGLGDPRIHALSTSYDPLQPGDDKSTGWRPWSKLETYQVSAVCSSPDNFDRLYSRAYMRRYAMPYNVSDYPKDFSYPTAHLGRDRDNRFNRPGSNREVLSRPGRDYKCLLDSSYQVKSYNRKVANQIN